MAISIDWETRVITVPRADLTLIQSTPSYIYNIDLNWFRIQLKDQEDSEIGMLYPITHLHNTEATLSGLTYARMIIMINNYTVTFEDGQYAVNLVGANSNIADATNVNQVSVRPQNSAGMISSPEIQYASFNGCVSVDAVLGEAGTLYPIGTPLRPVNNIGDAIAIAEFRGFNTFKLLSDLTVTTGQDISEYRIFSDTWKVVTIESGAITANTEFEKISLYGEMSGSWNVLIDCWVYTITNFLGWVRGGSIENVTLAPYVNPDPISYGSSYFDDLVPMYANVPSVLTMADDVKISLTNCADIFEIRDMPAGTVINIELAGGKIIIDSSCVGGDIIISGVGTHVNNSLLTIDDSGLINNELLPDAIMRYTRP